MTEMIRVLGSSGREGKGEGQFAQPRGVCINKATKELFVVDCNNHRIQVFHLLSLSFIRQIGKGTQGSATGFLMYPVGICMDDSNQLYIADTNNHRVVVFNHITGCYVRSIGAQGSALGCLNCPYGVYVDTTEGYLYVADYENNRIQVFDCETGNFVKIYGHGQGTGPGQFNQPIDVCLDHDLDYVIVADYSNNRVQVLSKTSGEYIKSIGVSTGPDALNGPRALCINRETNLFFISDRENHRIQLYNKTTHVLLRQIGLGLGVNPGQFNRPMELCVDNEEGVLIVVDGYNHRVQIIELPELQAERARLKLLSQKKVNTVLTKPVRPSLIAVNAHLNFSDARLIDLENSYFTIEYPSLGSPYTFTLSKDEVNLLRKTFPDFSQSLYLEGNEQMIEGIFVEKSVSKDNLLKQQADVFLNVLESLSFAESDDSILLMTAPSVVALHLLLVRGWSAHRFPLPVAKLILSLIINIEKGSTSYAETKKLLFASSELLKSALTKNSSLLIEVIPVLLESLRVLLRDSVIEINDFLGIKEKIASRPETEENVKLSEQTRNETKSLLYLLEILSCCFQLRDSAPVNLSSTNDSFDISSMLPNCAGDHYDSALIDMVFLVFGINSAYFLSKSTCRANNNSADLLAGLGSTLRIPVSFLAVVENIFNLLQLDRKPTVEEHRTNIAEKIISIRCSLFDAATTFFRDVHQANRLKESKTIKRTRGGRNVWDGISQIKPGDLIDCMDKEKSWFESLALEVQADGSVRVHFMGWGSKWDDIVLTTEISTRIAVLNTHTKDWRSELFEGGLIEIKCNDDLVNQKWMWGKITKLNREESWLEVAYSFSNEPVVVKKAWLWGETICPVGMHTKDKSRAAASLIARPEKTIAEMLKAKINDEIPEREICLFDSEDDYYENPQPQFDRGLSTGMIGGSVLNLSMLNPSSNVSKRNKENSRGLAFLLSETLIVRLAKELLLAISDLTSVEDVTIPKTILEQQNQSVVALIRCLTTLPCTKFVYHQIIKPLYFQAGGRAKLLAFLPQQTRESNYSTSDATIRQFTNLSESLLQLQKRYVGLISNLFNSALSSPSNQYVIEKLQSTILHCGFTPLANDLINSFLENEALLLRSFQPLLSSQRFHLKLIPTRKLFRSIISAASSDLVEKLLLMIERIIVYKNVQRFTNLEFLQGYLFSRENLSPLIPKDVTSEALRFIDEFTDSYTQTKFVISKEILQSNRLQCSVERLLSDEFNAFDSVRSKLLSSFLAEALFTPLLRSLIGRNKIRSDNTMLEYDYSTIASYMEKSLQIISLISNEELLYSVFQNFESTIWQRFLLLNDGVSLLTHTRFSNLKSHTNSLSVLPADLFEMIGETLPYGRRISSKLFSLNTSTSLTREFLLNEMDKIDVEMLSNSQVDTMLNEFHYFLSNGGEFSLSCLDYLRAPSILKVDYFKDIVLPPLFSIGQTAFQEFCHSSMNETLPFGIPKRLLWLKGFGKLSVECIIHSRKYLEITISEAQFAVLHEVSEKTRSQGGVCVLELSAALNLSVEVSKLLLQSLMNGPLKLINQKTVETKPCDQVYHHHIDEELSVHFWINEKDLISSAMQLMSIYSQSLQIDFYEGFLSLLEKHRTALYQGIISEDVWKENRVDACILRTLKNSSINSNDPLVSLSVLVVKCRSILQSTFHFIEEKEIVDRIFILLEKGFIYQNPLNSHSQRQEVILSYFPIESDAFGSIKKASVDPIATISSSPMSLKRSFISSPSRDDLLPQTVTFHSFTKNFFLDIHSSEELSKLFLQSVLSNPKLGGEIFEKKEQSCSSRFFFDFAVYSLGAIIRQMNLLLVSSLDSNKNSSTVAPCIDLFLALLHQIISRPPESLLSKVSWFHYCSLSPLAKYNVYSLFVQLTEGHVFRYDRDSFENPKFVAETISAIWDIPYSLNEVEVNSRDSPLRTAAAQNSFLRNINHYLTLNQATFLKQSQTDTEDNDNNEEKQGPSRDYFMKKNTSLSLSIFYKILMDYLSLDLDFKLGTSYTSSLPSSGPDREITFLLTAREDQTYHSTIARSPFRSRLHDHPSSPAKELSPFSTSTLYSNPTSSLPYPSLNFPSKLPNFATKPSSNPSKQSQKDFMSVLKDRVKDYKSRMNEVNFKKASVADASSSPPALLYSRENSLLTANVVQELLSDYDKEVLIRGQSSSVAPYSSFRSFSEHKSSSSFLSSPASSPFPFPSLNALNSDKIPFPEEVEYGVHDSSAPTYSMFLLPTFQFLEARLSEFFSNEPSQEWRSGASTPPVTMSNERVWTFFVDSVNHLVAELLQISPLASRIWWVNSEDENQSILKILQAGFDLHKKLRDSKNEYQLITSESCLKAFQQFLELRVHQTNNYTHFDRIILNLVELTGCSWNYCCENLQKNAYDLLDLLDSSYNERSTSESNIIRGIETVAASNSFKWICFSCVKAKLPSEMFALKTCAHFACRECWKERLLPKLTDLNDRLETLEDHPVLLLREFQCIRQGFDSECKCDGSVNIDLLVAVFEDDISHLIPVLQRVYKYYSDDFEQYQQKRKNAIQQHENLTSYLNLYSHEGKSLVEEGEKQHVVNERKSSGLCCSICINNNCFHSAEFRTSLEAVGGKQSSCSQPKNCDSFNGCEKEESFSVSADHYDHFSLKVHANNQPKISQFKGKIQSCEYSLQYCEDVHSFVMLQKQKQFWKLLLNCVYFYDHMFANHSKNSTASPVEDPFLTSFAANRIYYLPEFNESIYQFHCLHYQDIFSQLEERMAQYLQNQEFGIKTNSPSGTHAVPSTTFSPSMSVQIQAGILSLSSTYSFATLNQLVESVRNVHLNLYSNFVRIMKLSSKKQLYHLSRTSASIIHLKEEALRESDGKISGIGYENSYLNNLSPTYGIAPFLPKFPLHTRDLFREIEIKLKKDKPFDQSGIPKNLSKFDLKGFHCEMEEGETSTYLPELEQILQISLNCFKSDAGVQDRCEQSHQKVAIFLQKWKASIKELSLRKLTGFSTSAGLSSSDKLKHCFNLLYQEFIEINSFSQRISTIKEYAVQVLGDHLELFLCLVNYTTYYCKFNIHSALDIYLIDMSESEIPKKSDEIIEGLNLFTIIDIIIQGLENIIRISETSASIELPSIVMNTLDLFQTLVKESTLLISVVENKMSEFSNDLDHSNGAKVDAVLPITVSPSFITSLVGSPVPALIYRHLLLFYQKLIRISMESLVTGKAKADTPLEDQLEEIHFDRLQRICVNAMSLFYSNYRCLSNMSSSKDVARASSSIGMEINQKKDLLLMDIFEFLWKEILSRASLRSLAQSRELEIAQRQFLLPNMQNQNFDESSEDEVEAKTETTFNGTLLRTTQSILEAEKLLFKYSQLFVKLLHRVIVVVKRRGIDQRYEALKKMSSVTDSYDANQKMKEEDKKSLEKDISMSSVSDSNYFLMVSVVQRLLSNYHDILLMILDYLFSSKSLQNQAVAEEETCNEEMDLSDLLSEIVLEFFSNRYFVFLLRTIMNPVSITSSVQGLLQFSDSSFDSSKVFSYHDRVLSMIIKFFDEFGTFPLLDEKVRRLSSASSSSEKEKDAISQQSENKEDDEKSSRKRRFPVSSARDHTQKVLVQYLPPSTTNTMSLSPIIYEYSLAEVLHYLKQMLWSLNIVYTFWNFYFEYLIPSSPPSDSATSPTETQSSGETTKPPALVLQFNELLQHRQQLLSMISIHEYHELSSTFYTKSYYQNSFLMTQKLLELFFEKLIKPSLPSNGRTLSSGSPSFSQSKTISSLEEKKEGKIGKPSFSLVYPVEEEENDSQLFRDEVDNSDENIFNLKLSSLTEPVEEFYSYRRFGQRYRMEREIELMNREEASTIVTEEVEENDEQAVEDEEEDERHNSNNVFFNRWLRRNPSSLDLIRFFYLNQPNHLPTAFILESDDENEENHEDEEDDEDEDEEEDDNEDDDEEEEEDEDEEEGAERFHLGRNLRHEIDERDEEQERFH